MDFNFALDQDGKHVQVKNPEDIHTKHKRKVKIKKEFPDDSSDSEGESEGDPEGVPRIRDPSKTK